MNTLINVLPGMRLSTKYLPLRSALPATFGFPSQGQLDQWAKEAAAAQAIKDKTLDIDTTKKYRLRVSKRPLCKLTLSGDFVEFQLVDDKAHDVHKMAKTDIGKEIEEMK